MHTSLHLTVAALALLAGAASSQLGKIGLKIDLQTKVGTGNAGFLGCGFDGTDFYVTARAYPLVANGPHLLYRLDRQGNVLGVYNAPCPTYQSATVNPWGLRDLAFDGRYMYAGDESNIGYAFDTVTKAFDPTKNITGPAGLGIMRALAYDPATDTFWGSNFGGAVYNFKRDGTILFTGPSGATSMYGAAYDRVRKKLWWFGQGGSTKGTTVQVVGVEFDPVTQTPTGTKFIGDLTLAGTVQGGLAGGLDFYIAPNGEPTLLCLAQLNLDTMYEMPGTFVFGTSCAGGTGRVPEIGMQNDAPWLGNGAWQVTVSSAFGATSGLLYLGTSKTSYLGVPLPFDLGSVGMPNCKLNVALTTLVGSGPIAGGFGFASVPLPTDLSLTNAATYWQWLILDPMAPNPFRLTLSTGGQTILY